ncbi:MAG: hypothetical protein SLAVMIC_00349 [uncultured marine phage]|uniref:Uncharacterized protein n=1 Tax=uncultured marine phage TaxID=707152 RepID=A0A8D9C9V8_9VIRU|nr:MAG: hypothetical protein SLAVMIC_00349 [uncultured marine phage]
MNKVFQKIYKDQLKENFGDKYDEIIIKNSNFNMAITHNWGDGYYRILYDQKQERLIGLVSLMNEFESGNLHERLDEDGNRIGWTRVYKSNGNEVRQILNETEVIYFNLSKHREERFKKLLDDE